MNKKLDILVVEDKSRHQKSARLSLKDHNLTLESTYYNALRCLNGKKHDILITDMKFPLGNHSEGEYFLTRDIHESRDLGYAVAFYAALPHIAIPKIAILTDANHHSDAISATFDDFNANFRRLDRDETIYPFPKYGDKKLVFKINESTLVMFDERDVEEIYLLPSGKIGTRTELKKEVGDISGNEAREKYATKNWGKVLDIILEEPMTTKQFLDFHRE